MEQKKMGFWKKVGLVFKKIGNGFLNMLFPENIKCVFCGTDVPNFDEKPYCEECEKVVAFNNGHKCMICSEPIGNEAIVCDNCQKHKRHFVKAFCPFVYEGIVRSTVLNYKISNRRYLAKTFAKFIAKEIEMAKVKIDAITFVPMTKKKEKDRSFNQAKLLAVELAKILKVEVRDLFVKAKDGKGQKFSSFKERQENMIGMYELKKGEKLRKDETILIVDDVITTCATINYCSGLLEKKVKNVYVAAIARNKLKFSNNEGKEAIVPF